MYNNFRTAVAKFHPGRAGSPVALSDYGGEIRVTAYDKDLKQIWQHSERRLKDFCGRYVYPVDLNGDGIDEVVLATYAWTPRATPCGTITGISTTITTTWMPLSCSISTAMASRN